MANHQQIIIPLSSEKVTRVTKRRHRPLTEARREQNRAAQSRYRLNQKRIAEDSELPQSATPSNSGSPQQEQFQPTHFGPPTNNETESFESQLETWSDSFLVPDPLHSDTLFDRLYEEVSSATGSGTAVTPVDSIHITDMQSLPERCVNNLSDNSITNESVQLETRRTAATSSISNLRNSVPSGTFLFRNHIRLHDMTFLAATLAIAESIDVTADDYLNDRPSPFYLLSQATNLQLAADYFRGRVKPHLRPSITQLSRPHASYLDLIIFPQFRERAVLFSTGDPGILNQAQLMNDMLQGGLTCWGNAERGIGGRGYGVPWDMRSWEAKPWFLKKWWFLVGNEDDEMLETSRWWWEMRGEDASVETYRLTGRDARLVPTHVDGPESCFWSAMAQIAGGSNTALTFWLTA
ncbi:hypothetical protein F4679DRAFT_583396 [Xylaria curta]|nr:hypothetical protein F4679DRAFT_583396 [Xylaria curta]